MEKSLEVATPLAWGRSIVSSIFFDELLFFGNIHMYEYERAIKTRRLKRVDVTWRVLSKQPEARDDWTLGLQFALHFVVPCSFHASIWLISCLFRQRGGCVQRQAVHHSGDQACGSLRFDIETLGIVAL